ncbi:MAG: hypothetical protein AAGG46_11010 [Planctomycetota bacterium]
MTQPAVLLNGEQQRCVLESLLTTASHLDATIHAAATEPTHVHTIVSWRDDRTHEKVSTSLKRGVTITPKKTQGDQKWLSRDHSRRHVAGREHFDHLVEHYLPKHGGWGWNEARGYFRGGDG